MATVRSGWIFTAIGRRLAPAILWTAMAAGPACDRAPAPLRENPDFLARQERQRAEQAVYESARRMTPERAAQVEAAWREHPDDLQALRQILIYYSPDAAGYDRRDATELTRARRPYVLWLIEHHPAVDWFPRAEVMIYRTGRDALADAEGYDLAKALWLAHAARPDVQVETLSNAAAFLEPHDKVLAEQFLRRVQQRAPSAQVSRRLGRLYALTLLGADGPMPLDIPRFTSADVARGEFARAVRAQLETTRDAELLWSAGGHLLRARPAGTGDAQPAFDRRALGTALVARAVELNPDLFEARRLLAGERIVTEHEGLRLVSAAEHNLSVANDLAFYKKDADSRKLLAESKEQAQQALAVTTPQDPYYGAVVYTAKLTLAAHALHDGDREGAVRTLLEAASAPSSDGFFAMQFLSDATLVNSLLKAGERDSVVQFLERSAALRRADRDVLLRDAAAVRAGIMPERYNAMVARGLL